MSAANPRGVNGPRPGKTTGRLRNSATNIASKQTYPEQVAARPAKVPQVPKPAGTSRLSPPKPQQKPATPRASAEKVAEMRREQGATARPETSSATGVTTTAAQTIAGFTQLGLFLPGNPQKPLGGGVKSNVALGESLAAGRYGWMGKEWNALYELWRRESGWRTDAANPTSTARGIPQAMMSVHFGADWRTDPRALRFLSDPRVQILWGLRYIANRYGSPMEALAHSNQYGWY